MEVEPMVASPNGKARTRRRSTPTRVSVAEEVYRRMDDLQKKVDQTATKVERVANEFGTYQMASQRIEDKLDKLIHAVGDEEEDGQGGYIGTGMRGRLRRVEARQDGMLWKHRTLLAYGAGFITCLASAVGVIWWLIADKLEIVLKGTGQ